MRCCPRVYCDCYYYYYYVPTYYYYHYYYYFYCDFYYHYICIHTLFPGVLTRGCQRPTTPAIEFGVSKRLPLRVQHIKQRRQARRDGERVCSCAAERGSAGETEREGLHTAARAMCEEEGAAAQPAVADASRAAAPVAGEADGCASLAARRTPETLCSHPTLLQAWAPARVFEQEPCQCSGHCGTSGHRYWNGCSEKTRVITSRGRRQSKTSLSNASSLAGAAD